MDPGFLVYSGGGLVEQPPVGVVFQKLRFTPAMTVARGMG